MNLFKHLEKQANSVSTFKADLPVNSLALMMPSDGVPFVAKSNVQPILVIEEYEEDGFKSTYYVDYEIAKSLPKKKVASKVLHILQTDDSEVRFVLLNHKVSNSWNRSKLEAVKMSDEGKVISVTRDRDAGVYAPMIEHDINLFDIDMDLVSTKFDETFGGEFYIDSLDHPVVKKLLGSEGELVDVVVVDDKQSEKVEGTVDDVSNTQAETYKKATVLDESLDLELDEGLDSELDESLELKLDESLDLELDESLELKLDESLDLELDEDLDSELDESLELDEEDDEIEIHFDDLAA
ncbi:hypothetical protein L2729_02180 [Shewanella gelidimarina]|uniref:hypothetical protein n=1 Tax=Shewanella gelidimarina TaxID=56813 RepID=UPI00200C8B97|nr:hypothetical protein [Shewanella gelidimarina]MCL1056798.1 hypothetical protein [Shewanella gelidimarina]